MAHLTFEKFKHEIDENIMCYLPDEFKDYTKTIHKIRNSRGEYDALIIKEKDKRSTVTPALNLNQAYSQYENGTSMDDILKVLADIRMNAVPRAGLNPSEIANYEKVKGRLYPRLINTDKNAEYIRNVPSVKMEDLSIIYFVLVSQDSEGMATATVTNDLMNSWGIDRNTIHEQAMANLESQPYYFRNLTEALFNDFESSGDIEDIRPDSYEVPIYMLSNKTKVKGAIMAINHNIMERIIAKLGDVYIIPSSTEEVLIIPKTEADDLDGLVKIVKSVNEGHVAPEERLSDNVYEYNLENHTLSIAK